MSRNFMIGVAAAALLGIFGGYRLGAGSWPFERRAEPTPAVSGQGSTATRRVLYWKDPDGKADFAPAPKKTVDGRDYLPVYDDEEPPLAGTQSGRTKGKGKILYYRNPMGLADTSPVPKKDWMGMDYIPVYEGEEQDVGTVRVSLDRVQRAGVRSEAAIPRILARPIKAPAGHRPRQARSALVDKGDGRFEPRAIKLGMRGDGFVEILHGVSQGENVVVSANFLIDAESNLKAALAGFTAESNRAPDAKP